MVRDYIYIDDLCKMLYSLMDYHGDIEVFNLSSNTGVSQNDIVEILKKIVSDVRVVYKPARSVDAKKIILDNTKIRTICNLDMISVEEGINRYYKNIKQGK